MIRVRPSPFKKDDAIFLECPCGDLLVAVSVDGREVVLEAPGREYSVTFPIEFADEVLDEIRRIIHAKRT